MSKSRVANPRDAKVGALVKSRRARRTQEWLAVQMQYYGHRWSQSTVWAVENGYQSLTITQAQDLAEILKIDVADFGRERNMKMKNYELTYEGRVREVYSVMAETEDEARRKWMDTEPVSSEVIDGEIVKVEETGN